MTWHNTSHHIASNDVTITWPDPGTDIKTSKHFTSKHKTSPPWKGRRLVHSKEMIWASRWSVTMRTFYRQILSVLYSSFPFGNFRPRLVRALLVMFIMENPFKMDDLGVPLFLETAISSTWINSGIPTPWLAWEDFSHAQLRTDRFLLAVVERNATTENQLIFKIPMVPHYIQL